MTAVPALLPAGVGPWLPRGGGARVNEAGSGGAVVRVRRTPPGIALGPVTTAPAAGPAAVAVTRPKLLAAPDRTAAAAAPAVRARRGPRARLPVGATAFGALALPGVLST
ncbi:hypothetical protein [Streptomyces sp. NPDC047706]|uniref:hypothetical protein n=1 Tax=Streptomyces sp. NPDC047706 TaxID=3365486 RepID=UPI003723CE5E